MKTEDRIMSFADLARNLRQFDCEFDHKGLEFYELRLSRNKGGAYHVRLDLGHDRMEAQAVAFSSDPSDAFVEAADSLAVTCEEFEMPAIDLVPETLRTGAVVAQPAGVLVQLRKHDEPKAGLWSRFWSWVGGVA